MQLLLNMRSDHFRDPTKMVVIETDGHKIRALNDWHIQNLGAVTK